MIISMTLKEMQAAHIACSNFTPPPKEKWMQKNQASAASKLQRGIWAWHRKQKEQRDRIRRRP